MTCSTPPVLAAAAVDNRRALARMHPRHGKVHVELPRTPEPLGIGLAAEDPLESTSVQFSCHHQVVMVTRDGGTGAATIRSSIRSTIGQQMRKRIGTYGKGLLPAASHAACQTYMQTCALLSQSYRGKTARARSPASYMLQLNERT